MTPISKRDIFRRAAAEWVEEMASRGLTEAERALRTVPSFGDPKTMTRAMFEAAGRSIPDHAEGERVTISGEILG